MGAGQDQVGVTATLEGTYTMLGVDGIAGFNAAVKKYGGKAGGKELEFVIASTDATPDSAVRAVRKLIEQDHVQILISPLSGDEGIAVKNFLQDPSGADVHQRRLRRAGDDLPRSVAEFLPLEHGRRAMVRSGSATTPITIRAIRRSRPSAKTIPSSIRRSSASSSNSAPLGGQVTSRQWVPLGTKDFASTIAALPDDVDAIYLGLGGADAVNFLNQYQQAGGKAHLLGGSIMVDQTVLSAKGDAKKAMIGTIAASGMADTWDDPGWQAFVKLYQDATPADKRLPSPGLLATNYYGATMAMFEALNKVNGDLSDNQSKLKAALAALTIDAPNGKISLDEDRQAIGTNFVTEVVDDGKGGLVSKVVKVVPDVHQTLGYPTRRCSPRSGRRAAPIRSARSTELTRVRPGARSRPAAARCKSPPGVEPCRD